MSVFILLTTFGLAFPPFTHSWMKDGWMMTEMIFWMTCTWTC